MEMKRIRLLGSSCNSPPGTPASKKSTVTSRSATRDLERATDRFRVAARRFRTVGQPLDAARCQALAYRQPGP